MPRCLLALVLLAGCAPAPTPFTSEHQAALRDSVTRFLDDYAADLSAPPLGRPARDALARFYASDLVMSTDLAPVEPLVVQTLDSLVPPTELVSQPPFVRGTRFEWGQRIVTPLAPGLATFTAKYVEQVTDTTGAVTRLPGVQHGIARHGPDGWRLLTVQSAHPAETHQEHAALQARFQSTPR